MPHYILEYTSKHEHESALFFVPVGKDLPNLLEAARIVGFTYDDLEDNLEWIGPMFLHKSPSIPDSTHLADSVFLGIDGDFLRKQRIAMDELLNGSSSVFTQESEDALIGLENLLDVIADTAHDCYGLDSHI